MSNIEMYSLILSLGFYGIIAVILTLLAWQLGKVAYKSSIRKEAEEKAFNELYHEIDDRIRLGEITEKNRIELDWKIKELARMPHKNREFVSSCRHNWLRHYECIDEMRAKEKILLSKIHES